MTVAEKIVRAKADYDAVYEAGKKAEYDAFWGSVFSVDSWQYLFAGRAWTAETFKPPHDLILSGNCNYCFYGNGANVDLVDRLAELGIRMTTTAATSANSIFATCRFTRLGVLDFTNCTTLSATFSYASQVQTIDEVIVHENLKFTGTFSACYNLEEIRIKGTIGQSGLDFQSCKKLSKASFESIVAALSTTTSGLTVTFFKTAKEAAFTADEWSALIATRPNWTISLV